MLAKVPPKRADGSSSFSALVDYATERDEEKETQTDELNPGHTRRDDSILESAREHIERAADRLREIGRIDAATQNAIRERARSIGIALDSNGRRYQQDQHPVPVRIDEPGPITERGVSADGHESRLAVAQHHLAAAANHLRQAVRNHPDFAARARSRGANLAFHAAAAQRRDAGDELNAIAELESGLLLGAPVREVTRSGVSCQHNCLSLATAAAEMKAVAAQNSRVKDPVYHVILSWPQSEKPTDDQAFDCALHAMDAVGMAEHQYVFAIHHDTDNVHLHMTVNRVHPDSYNAVYPDRDYFKLDYAMRELELRYGWTHDNGPYSVIDKKGSPEIAWSAPKPKFQGKQPTRAADMERHLDQESLHTYSRGEPRDAIATLLKKKSLTWQKLHAELARFGLGIKPKGRGMGIYSLEEQSLVPIKASDMHEALSKARLEKRLGDYEERKVTQELMALMSYDKFASPRRNPEDRQQRRTERANLRRALRARYEAYRTKFVYRRVDKEWVKQQFKRVRDDSRQQRLDIKLRIKNPKDRKAFYSILAFETLRAREELETKISKMRADLKNDPSNKRLSYREWVEQEAATGDPGAISQLRGFTYGEKRAAKAEGANGFEFARDLDPKYQSIDGMLGVVRRNGTVIYRRAAGDPGFEDLGGQFNFPGQAVDSELITRALRAMPNTAPPGPLRITGSAEFKRSLIEALVDERYSGALADPELEKLLHELKAERDAQQRSRSGPRGG